MKTSRRDRDLLAQLAKLNTEVAKIIAYLGSNEAQARINDSHSDAVAGAQTTKDSESGVDPALIGSPRRIAEAEGIHQDSKMTGKIGPLGSKVKEVTVWNAMQSQEGRSHYGTPNTPGQDISTHYQQGRAQLAKPDGQESPHVASLKSDTWADKKVQQHLKEPSETQASGGPGDILAPTFVGYP